jgi:hypothetical protein
MSTVHIYAPPSTGRSVRWAECPDCGKRSPMASIYYEWHGPHSTCMRCGRSWSDGEWMPLAFSRTARRDSRDQMRRSWKRARP